jgi:Flp pilus assembly protein CpaB
VVRHDLPGGASLTAADLQVEPWDTAHLPGGVLTDPGQAVGHRTAGPVRAGEALTDVRLASSAGLGDPSSPDEVAVPVRLADASLGGLLDPGVLVDVIAADGHGSARVVAEDAEVLSIPGGSSATGDAFEGVLVVLSVPPDTATELAAAAAVGPLSVSLRG